MHRVSGWRVLEEASALPRLVKYSIQPAATVSRYDSISMYPLLRLTRYECFISLEKRQIHPSFSGLYLDEERLIFNRKRTITADLHSAYIRDVLKILIQTQSPFKDLLENKNCDTIAGDKGAKHGY